MAHLDPEHGPFSAGPVAELDGRSVRAAYRAASAQSLRQRIDFGVLAFAAVGAAILLQEADAWERSATPLTLLLVVQATVCVTALLLARWGRIKEHLPAAGAILVSGLTATMVAEDLLLGLTPEVVAVGLVSILACTAALFPWGWRAQLGVSVATVAIFVTAEVFFLGPLSGHHAHVALGVVAVATVAGALLLERYRFSAFQRAARLERASQANREEAEISGALVQVGQTLSSAVGEPDAFDRVNRLIVDLLGCDWSATVTLDADRGVFRVIGMYGLPPRVRERARAVEFPRRGVAFFDALQEGGMLEIEDTSATELMTPAFVQRFGLSAALAAPIVLGSQVVGAVTNGYRDHRGPFSRKHRGITAGVAQATAVAVQNQRLFDDLARANRIKGQFVSTMSHELRTPVNVILGFARVLEEGDAGTLTPEQRDLVVRIRRSGARLGELVDGILDLSRLESGAERLKLDWVELDAFISGLEDEFRPEVGAGLVLQWQNHLPGRRVLSEAPRLRTIVRQLVANAVKFTPHGHVRVEFAQSGASLVVTVSDSGIGIAPEHVESIFDDFHQIDSTDSREFGGVGLGLHIVRRLVDRLGGAVAVVSEPGRGSVFTVEIPAQFARARGA